MTTLELAHLMADEIVRQGNEIDNLGDNESIVLMNDSPTINLVELAEKIRAPIRASVNRALELLAQTRDDEGNPQLRIDQAMEVLTILKGE